VQAPNSALAIFRSRDSVDELLKACPLKFSLESVQSYADEEEQQGRLPAEGPADIEDDYNTPAVPDDATRVDGKELFRRPGILMDQPLPQVKPHAAPPSHKGAASNILPQRTEFKVSADVWLGKQEDYNERTPFWGAYVIDTRSRIQQDLKKRVPVYAYSSLDVPTEEVPIRILRKRQEEMAGRMTVREYYNIAMSNPEVAQEATRPAGGEWDDGPPDAASKLPWRKLPKPRRPLAYALPPTPRFNEYDMKYHELGEEEWSGELRTENGAGPLEIGDEYDPRARKALGAGGDDTWDISPNTLPQEKGSRASNQRIGLQMGKNLFEPRGMPESAKQYGALFQHPGPSQMDKPPTTEAQLSTKQGSLGEQVITSIFGEDAMKAAPEPRYSKSRKEKSKSKKDKSQIDDPADIEAALRRGVHDKD
jgi:hypothetical protein